MKTKILLVLTVITVAAVSYLLISSQDKGKETTSQRLFPDFNLTQLNQLKAITLQSRETTTTLSNQNNQWVIESFHNYPADVIQIRDLLRFFLDAKKLSEKTSDAEYYDRLGVGDPAQPGANNRLVYISGDDFKGELIFGNLSKQVSVGQYVRKPNEQTTWLVDQKFVKPLAHENWLDKEIININKAEIQSVLVFHIEEDSGKVEELYKLEQTDQPSLSFQSVGAIPSTLNLVEKSQELKRDIARLSDLTDYMTFKRLWPLSELAENEVKEEGAEKSSKPIEQEQEKIHLKYISKDGFVLLIEAYKKQDKELFRVASETTDYASEEAIQRSKLFMQKVQDYAYEMPSSFYSGLLISHRKIMQALYPKETK
ncbi:MAG: DUF4340 domain-containing protein [Candidatus Oxydemutatoraceae bacterium WSBS_2016_MAG_OTU14]